MEQTLTVSPGCLLPRDARMRRNAAAVLFLAPLAFNILNDLGLDALFYRLGAVAYLYIYRIISALLVGCSGAAFFVLRPLAANRTVGKALALGAVASVGWSLVLLLAVFLPVFLPDLCYSLLPLAVSLSLIGAISVILPCDRMELVERRWVGLIAIDSMWSVAVGVLLLLPDTTDYYFGMSLSRMHGAFDIVWSGLLMTAYYRLTCSGAVAGPSADSSAEGNLRAAKRCFLRLVIAFTVALVVFWTFCRYAAPLLAEVLDWRFMRLI